MTPKRRLQNINFLVDTNCVNARQKMAAMNRLETWAANEIIDLLTAETAQDEMAAGGSSQRTQKAYSFITTLSEVSTPDEQVQLSRIKAILDPSGAATKNQSNDIDIVFNAWKYHMPLVTNDGGSKSQPGGILGNQSALQNIGISVLTPEDAVARVEEALDRRDDLARQWADYYGKPLPDWVGQDR